VASEVARAGRTRAQSTGRTLQKQILWIDFLLFRVCDIFTYEVMELFFYFDSSQQYS